MNESIFPLRVGDLIDVTVDFPDRPMFVHMKPFDRGRYRVTKVQEALGHRSLPDTPKYLLHRYCACLVKEAKNGRQYKYEHYISMSYFDSLLKSREMTFIERDSSVITPL